MKHSICREGMMAFAQNSIQDYVQFYTIGTDQCQILDCININQVSVDPGPESWILIVMGLGGAGIADSVNKLRQ